MHSQPSLAARAENPFGVYEHTASGRKTPALFANAEDGHHEVKLCEAVLKSSKSKGWVKV